MHRVDADGYKTVSGKRRFEDQSLPGTAGTLDAELWKNAVQEELCNLIEYTGITLKSTGLIDEASGWNQLRQAIFSSAKIDSAAITDGAINDLKLNTNAVTNIKVNDVSVAKLTAGTAGTDDIAITLVAAPSTFNWLQNAEKVRYSENDTVNIFTSEMRADFLSIDTDSTTYARLESDFLRFTGNTNHTVLLNNDSLVLSNSGTDIITTIEDTLIQVVFDDSVDEKSSEAISTEVTVQERSSGAGSSAMETTHKARGIRYSGSGSPGTTSFKSVDVRKGQFEYTGAYASEQISGDSKLTYNFSLSNDLVLTGVPPAAEIFSIFVRYTTVGGNEQVVPVRVGIVNRAGAHLTLQSVRIISNSVTGSPDPPTGSAYFTVEYEANNL